MEEAKIKPPVSLVQFLRTHAGRLGEAHADENLLEQLILWIDNNAINYQCEDFMYLSSNKTPSRMIYAMLRNSSQRLSEEWITIKGHGYGLDALNKKEEFMLFSPFSLPQNESIWGKLYSIGERESEELEIWRHKWRTCYNANNTIKYLSTNKNLNVIKIILLLVQHGRNFSSDTARACIKKNLTGNETMSDGTTALMFAVGGGYLELARELLNRGANPFQANKYGDDALSIVDVQLRRTLLHNQTAYYAIYEQIKALLDEAAKKRAKDVARAIYTLMLAKVVENLDGTRNTVRGLPYEIALRIVMSTVSNHEEQRIRTYLEELTVEEQVTLCQEVQGGGVVATSSFLERVRNYLPTRMINALPQLVLTVNHTFYYDRCMNKRFTQ